MKNLFLHVMFVIFALASATSGVSDREAREVSQRIRRSDDQSLWGLFKEVKDKKKKNKNKNKKKNKKTTATPTTVRVTTSPAPIPTTKHVKHKGTISDKVLKKLLSLNTTKQLDHYLGITSAMSMSMRAKETQLPPPPSQKTVVGQNIGSGEVDCACKISRQRIFLQNPHRHLGMYYPNNCVETNLCVGGCLIPDYQECRAVDKKVIQFNKPYIYYVGGFSVMSHKIEYHSSCACQCKRKKCHERMVFRNDYCECRCKKEYSRRKLKCKAPFEYDTNTCSCFCPFKFRVCPKGQVWHANSCSCKCAIGKVMIGGKCSAIAMSNGK